MRIIVKHCCSCFLYLFILLAVIVFQPATSPAEAQPLPSPQAPTQADSVLAGLSDEQVRQMLLSELRRDAMEDQYARQQQQMVGPAGLFHRLLQKISSEHNDNEKQFTRLWSGIPQLIPDLRKVFLNL